VDENHRLEDLGMGCTHLRCDLDWRGGSNIGLSATRIKVRWVLQSCCRVCDESTKK